MAINNFVAHVWAARVLENLRKNLVYGQPGVVNKDYEGDIREAGDRVHIHSIAPVTIGDYVKNTTTITYQELTDSRQTLLIDQSKYFAFKVDDIDKAQQQPKILDAATREASYNLANVADRFLAGKHTEAGIQRPGPTTQTALTSANVYTELVGVSQTLDENDVPEEGRYAIVPPWVASLLLNNDRFVAAKKEAVLNGEIGQVAGLSILKSNNVRTTGTTTIVHHIMAGHSSALSFAEQINNVEAFRLEGSFADGVRGLHLYGAKVARPNALIDFRVTQ